ncbi:probable linoleate 9S-lipoxygenase 5 [Rosa rugosa]|uniref:probable linoleate 9S-lipoxygenase 5 n=1 Tax=Rosa rugosa TaxID=74645 RepID=UPI002B40F9BA|nr:probable linoleate 9S-lipoxygenase 5 [Rosa rugosa]
MLHFKCHHTLPLNLIRTKPPPSPCGARLSSAVAVNGRPLALLFRAPGSLFMANVRRSRPLTVSAAKSSQSTTTIDPPSDDTKIKGTVVLMKKNLLELNDLIASFSDRVHELFGKSVSVQLISAVNTDPGNGNQGKVGKPAYLKNWITKFTPLTAEECAFEVNFDWDEKIGVPGAFIIRNEHSSEFYLKSLTLGNVPGEGKVHFDCNSWVYPADKYKKDRIFFTNKTYLSSETPVGLKKFREEELVTLRGDGVEKGELQTWDRVYDYATYNDLGSPDKGEKYARPILGGSTKFPYPRRGRTGRPATKKDPNSESPLPLIESLFIYVPRDERFGHLKMSDLIAYALKSISQILKPDELATLLGHQKEFNSLEHVLKLYEGGLELPNGLLKFVRSTTPAETVKELFRTDGERLLKFPVPQVIKEDKSAWRTDEEFAREMLAGLNPVSIRRLQEFPPASKLDRSVYGDQTSKITKEHIADKLDGLSIDEAINKNKLFILDHHDSLMPYLERINSTDLVKGYASRTLLFLTNDGTLKPIAIELSLPHPGGVGCTSEVYTPSSQGVESHIWQLAKAYVAINDSGYHQLVSHWLRTHAVIEPVIIATNRQLSVLHPIHKLLHPHFRDTMNVNAVARQILINSGGVLENTVFPAKYSMEWSSVMYKDSWVFPEQALPKDLIKRGMAVEDSSASHGVRLLIEDYPYAADGLEIWSAIKTWVEEYCSFYFKTDEMVQKDSELQSWWKELREEGHGDKKDEPWWPKMQTVEELIESCTIIIWTASAYHAAINFGQYPYGGYPANRPSISRRFMPKEGTPEYEQLKNNPEKAFLETVTPQLQTLLGMASIEILSRHSADELYLGQRDSQEWTTDTKILQASENFRNKLKALEERVTKMNKDDKLKNRTGPAKMPYTLLYPTSEPGLTGKGIPNSVSI